MSGFSGHDANKRRLLGNRLVLVISLAIFLIGAAVLLVLLGQSKKDDSIISKEPVQSVVASANAAPNTPTPLATPGIVVIGYVRSTDGKGVENVKIFRRYASYPGEVIATTDANGYYQSAFYAIPGDEMVTLWAESDSLVFEPEFAYWRHYHGYELSQHDFTTR